MNIFYSNKLIDYLTIDSDISCELSEFCISHQDDKHSQHFAKIRAGSMFKHCLSDDRFKKDNRAFANYSSLLPSFVFITEPE